MENLIEEEELSFSELTELEKQKIIKALERAEKLVEKGDLVSHEEVEAYFEAKWQD